VEQKSEVLTPKRTEDVVHLYDQVTVERPQGINSSFMRVETEYLQLLPDADIVKTDQRIKLITDNGETLATGMMANNTNQELRLLSKVHARLSKHK
jgi:LPS export ABC transporter protein LptC